MALHSSIRCTLVALFGLSTAMAQSSASISGTVGATIVHPAQAIGISELSFGTVMPSRVGQVTIAPDGTLTLDGKPAADASETGRAGNLVVKGGPRTSLSVCLPDQVELSGPKGAKLTVSGFRSDFTSGATNSRGERAIGLGATLAVASDSQQGRYVGYMDVLVAYN